LFKHHPHRCRVSADNVEEGGHSNSPISNWRDQQTELIDQTGAKHCPIDLPAAFEHERL
jgi:hypothetical protein